MPDTLCQCCSEKCVKQFVDDTVSVRYEGKNYTVEVSAVPVMDCPSCGTRTSGGDLQTIARRALRRQLGLLQPEDIKAMRESLGLTQEDVERILGIATESLSRWENDRVIQSRAMNKFLHTFYMAPDVFERPTDSVPTGVTKPEYAGVQATCINDQFGSEPQFALAA